MRPGPLPREEEGGVSYADLGAGEVLVTHSLIGATGRIPDPAAEIPISIGTWFK